MKKHLNKVTKSYHQDISLAKANQFEGIILPVSSGCEPYCIHDVEDEEYMCEMAFESGWDAFVLIDFINNEEKVIDLCEYEAA
ncbi:MAG: hypothetical protein U9R37_00450 [Campylobacterota bacterium]|nr:hypothetical protein [Campylobacterota bacterium]